MVLFFSLVSQHPRQARQIKAKEAEILGLWNGLKVGNQSPIKRQVNSLVIFELLTPFFFLLQFPSVPWDTFVTETI